MPVCAVGPQTEWASPLELTKIVTQNRLRQTRSSYTRNSMGARSTSCASRTRTRSRPFVRRCELRVCTPSTVGLRADSPAAPSPRRRRAGQGRRRTGSARPHQGQPGPPAAAADGLDALRRQGREGVRLEAARARGHGGRRDRVRGARRRAGRRTRLPLGTVITSSAPSRGPGSTAACARAARPGPGQAVATATPAARRARARAASPAATALTPRAPPP